MHHLLLSPQNPFIRSACLFWQSPSPDLFLLSDFFIGKPRFPL
jgi:hypothetical protein